MLHLDWFCVSLGPHLLFAQFSHLQGEPLSGSSMNENVTWQFKYSLIPSIQNTDLAIGEYIVILRSYLFDCSSRFYQQMADRAKGEYP